MITCNYSCSIAIMILYFLIAYTLGIVAITLYLVYFFKTKKKVFLNIVIFDFNFLLIVLFTVLYSINPNELYMILDDVICALLGFTLMYFALSTRVVRHKKIIELIYFVIAVGLAVISVLYNRITNFVFGFLAFSIATSMIVLIYPDKSKKKQEIDPFGKFIGIFSLLFLPLIVFFDFFPEFNPINKYFDFTSFPLFYFLLNAALLAALKGEFWSRVRDFNLIKKKFLLTDRELEVLILLISAKSYKEISDELCISMSTVKTHISKIYQKSNTNSKVELIALIDS